MKASDIMTSSPCYCSPADSLEDVAQIMRDNDCGAVPVVEDGRIIGIVTDRDLTVRALAHGMSADAKVAKFFTRDPHCCRQRMTFATWRNSCRTIRFAECPS